MDAIPVDDYVGADLLNLAMQRVVKGDGDTTDPKPGDRILPDDPAYLEFPATSTELVQVSLRLRCRFFDNPKDPQVKCLHETQPGLSGFDIDMREKPTHNQQNRGIFVRNYGLNKPML